MSLSSRKKWKYALVQHPMWLLIAEDTVCAERTPPWGSPTIEEYAECLGKSLDSLERHPELLINFDFSAVELEDFAENYPDLMRRMRALTDAGRISFLNGTYSQPHLQMLSIESAIRQFEYGLHVIEALTGYRVRCYAAQEPGFSPQLPQILNAFGYDTVSTPSFPFGVRVMDGRIQHWNGRWQWLDGDDIVDWLGQDGTTIPTWLKTSGCPNEELISDDAQHGLLNTTRLRVDMPDLIEINQDWVDERTQLSELVTLDSFLAEFAGTHPNRAKVVFDANYAYAEGADAELLSRMNTRAEAALLRLETLTALLPVDSRPAFDFDSAWRVFLKAQHHDAYWTGAPELRAKSVGWLTGLERTTNEATHRILQSLGAKLPTAPQTTKAVAVAHSTAEQQHGPVEFDVEEADVQVVRPNSQEVRCQTRKCSDGAIKATVVASADGVGYSVFFVKPGGGKTTASRKLGGKFRFKNAFYSAEARPDGVVSALRSGGRNVLAGEGNRWICVQDGRDLSPVMVEGSARVERGPVYDAIESCSELNSTAVTNRLTFYHGLPFFDVEVGLRFREPTDIGDYFDDRTKLHFAWKVGRDAKVVYLSGGCPESARPGKSFVAYPAVSACGKRGGFSICLDSAAKCWLDEDGVLRCVVAWGHNGDHFHNRQGPLPGIMGPLSWLKPMDLLLRGEHAIRYRVKPNGGTLSGQQLVQFASGTLGSPVAALVETGGGELPWSDTILSIRSKDLIQLSVRPAGTGAVLRLLNTSSGARPVKLRLATGWKAEHPRKLDGTELRCVPPHTIAEIGLVREEADE